MRDFSSDLSALALNTATLGHLLDGYGAGWSPSQVIDACAKRGFGGITFWGRELGEQAARIGEQTRASGLRVTGLCRPPYLVGPEADPVEQKVVDGFREAVEMAAALKSDSLTVVVGGVIPGSHSISLSLGRVTDLLEIVLPHAIDCGVKLGLEPLHPVYASDRSCLVSVADAIRISQQIDHPNLGIVIDVYHVWWDLSLAAQISQFDAKLVFAYHLCDWLTGTRDILFDRGMMGDGVADLKGIRAALENVGYCGHCEVEIFSKDNWWKRPPDEVLDVITERFRTVC